MEYAIELLEDKLNVLTAILVKHIDIKEKDSWKELNAKKRILKRAISILKDGNKVQDQNG